MGIIKIFVSLIKYIQHGQYESLIVKYSLNLVF